MPSALDIFDYCQTIVIFLLLIITIPLASYVYSKLLFSRPFSESYTFKLIVFQGTTELLASVMYLFVFQLTTFEFMRGFYNSVQKLGLSTLLAALNTIIGYLALHSSLFVSLNRAKTMLFLRRNDNDFILFIISICLSFILAIPVTIHYCTSISSYETIQIGDESILVPYNFVTVTIWRTIASITSSVISVITLIMNIILCFLITRERKFINMTDLQKFNVEKGLVITSIVSFATYMLYFIDNQISVQFSVVFCGYAKWMFIGIKSVMPFWCLVAFTPSVRKLIFARGKSNTITTIQNTTSEGNSKII